MAITAAQLKKFVDDNINDPVAIAQAAAANNVSLDAIAAATGYDTNQVMNYLKTGLENAGGMGIYFDGGEQQGESGSTYTPITISSFSKPVEGSTRKYEAFDANMQSRGIVDNGGLTSQILSDLGPVLMAVVPWAGASVGAALGVSATTGAAIVNAGLQAAQGKSLEDIALGFAKAQLNNAVSSQVASELKGLSTDPLTQKLITATGTTITSTILNGGGANELVTNLAGNIVRTTVLDQTGSTILANAAARLALTGSVDSTLATLLPSLTNINYANVQRFLPLSDEDIADLEPGAAAAYAEGGTKGLLDYRQSIKTLTGLTGSGRTGDDLGGGYTDAEDILTTLQGAGLTETGLGDQDVLDYLNASSVTGGAGNDVVTGGAVDTVSVTGAAGNDVVDGLNRGLTGAGATSVTGATGNDAVVITDKKCDSGFVYDEDLKMCVPITNATSIVGGTGNDTITGGTGNDTVVITDKKCDVGMHYDEDLKMCVLDAVEDTIIGAKGNDTIVGGGGNDEVVITDKKCDQGFVYDEDLKMCVAEEKTLVCDAGFHEENGVCVKDKLVCDAGYHEENGVCVKDKLVCDPGFHEENGVCVKDTLVCDTGYHEENGVCVKDKLTCPAGFKLNAEGTACIAEVEVVDNKCDPGFVYDEDLKMCVLEEKELVCDTGFHEENGVCVKDKLVCDAGYHEENGVCVKDKLVCDKGFHEENGVCVKDKITCPAGKVLNAEGTACIDEVVIKDKKCDPGFVYDEDLKMCVAEEKTLVCDAGFHEENGVCVKDKLVCDTGFHEENGVCVKDKLTCPTGFKPNDAGTECIPEVVIVDKKCDPGFVYDEDLKMCVAETKTLVCDAGFHEENGVCVKDKLVCDTGYHEEDGVCVKDKLVCDKGFKLNDAGTECIPEIIIKDKKCDPGFVYDEDLKMCVAETTTLVCDAGYHEENGVCVKDKLVCDTGYHEENGVCVKDKLVCDKGFKLNEAGTECIPEIIIKDKKCDPGFVYDETLQKCVAEKTTLVCDKGFHEENGVCVKDKLVCNVGFHEENGVCVKDKLVCATGFKLNEAGTECIPEVVITDKKCDVGFVYDETLKMCVKEKLVCNAGYHEENGVCVKDKLVCDTGFHEENGVCVKDKLVCATGFHEEKGVCVKDAVITTPVIPTVVTPPTSTLPAAPVIGPYTDTSRNEPIYAGAMDDFNFLATLQDLLSDNGNKKATQQGQQTTKMATGGHLDDLLAEQITVDDLLKLLR